MSRFAVLPLWWNDRVNIFVFEKLEVLAVGISGIGSESLDLFAGVVFDSLYLIGKLAAFALLAGGDLHIDNDTTSVVDSGMLLIAGLHTKRVTRCGQCRIRVGFTAFLGPWRLCTRPARPFGFVAFEIVLLDNRFGVLCGQAFPTDISTNESRIYMNCFAVNQPGIRTALNGLLKNPLETFIAPTPANLRKRAMVRQLLIESVTGEPANCKINLRFTHELAVVNNALKESRQHQTNRCFRINAGSAVVAAVQVFDLASEPG